MADVLQIVGGIAGIGGLALGVLLLIYRDIISRKVFPTLESGQATMLLGSMIVLTFVIAILGIFAGLASGEGALPFIALVAVVLAFIIVVLVIAARFISARRAPDTSMPREEDFDVRIGRLVEARQFDEAERALSRAAGQHKRSSRPWYWRSRIALARGNVDVALNYLNEALTCDDRDECNVALHIKLLLLSSKRGDRAKAKAQVEQSFGISDTLDTWLTRVKAEGMLGPGVRSNTELDAKCGLPTPLDAGGHGELTR